MLISAIAAVDLDYTLGKDGGMPWRLPSDMRFFRRMTLGKPVIMGRRTWASLGGPLKDRANIVITSTPDAVGEGAQTAPSLDAALALCAGAAEVMIIGGAALYHEALERTDRLYLTVIHHRFGGDTHLATLNPDGWRLAEATRAEVDDKNAWPHTFCTLDRAPGAPALLGAAGGGAPWVFGGA
jgi:dihydrofolate reductase